MRFDLEISFSPSEKSHIMTSLRIVREDGSGHVTQRQTLETYKCISILTKPSKPNCIPHSHISCMRSSSSKNLSGLGFPQMRMSCTSSAPSCSLLADAPSRYSRCSGREAMYDV